MTAFKSRSFAMVPRFGTGASTSAQLKAPTATHEGPDIGVAHAARSANESAKQPVGRGIAVELSTGHMP